MSRSHYFLVASALLLTACGAGSSGDGGGSEAGAGEFSFLTNVENTTIPTELETLAGEWQTVSVGDAVCQIET